MNAHARKILVVDDFEIVRRVMRDSLEKVGLTDVDEAEDGPRALQMLKTADSSGAPYAMVFCDWNMPGMNGLDVLNECRKHETLKDMPFIMVTAESEQDAIVKALQAGATDYVIKPVTPDVLQRKALRLMARVEY